MQYKDAIHVNEEEINNLTAHLQVVQTQYEVGTVAFSDVLATNVQLANSHQALNSAHVSYENSISTLNNIIGAPVDTVLIIDDDLKFITFNRTESECLEFALKNRPDAIAAGFNVNLMKKT